MQRVSVRVPTRLARFKSSTTKPLTEPLRTVANATTTGDASLADKFNLASLNGGKNPFDTASERLLREAPKKAKNDSEMKDMYSLDYLLGKKVAKPAKAAETETKKNPFDVASAKLM